MNVVTFAPDGRRLASGSSNCTVRIWDVIAAKEVLRRAGHVSEVQALAYSPDGTKLASDSFDTIILVCGLGGQ